MGVREALAALLAPRGDRSVDWVGPTFQSMVLGLTPEELYRTQPHLRTVLSFVARNVAHLGLHGYERVSDTDRKRLSGDPLSDLLSRPNPEMTRYELINTLVSDLGLYDAAYWVVSGSSAARSGWEIRPIPPAWIVEHRGGTAFAVGKYVVQNPGGQRLEIAADDMIVFHGWNPGRPKFGTPPVETLKQVLAEQVQAWSYRQQIWQRGGRVGAYLTRPSGANWSDSARERFAQDWKTRWTGMDGAKAGGTPILEDGMELKKLGFSAREEEWAEVSKVALSTVASVFHVNPVMVGILDNANFSNTKEFRKMLYSETLGPMLAMIEDRLNAFLVPRVTKVASAYVEFNIAEKLQGDFEEQAQVLSSSTGAPWMTRNEARARQNLPSIDGGDVLVTPLNVLIGGQASPRDAGSQNVRSGTPMVKGAEIRLKALKSEAYDELAAKVLERFFERQRTAVLSALSRKADAWWDGERWDGELSADLLKLSLTVTAAAARQMLADAGLRDDYDEAQTVAFLTAVAGSRASAINSTTRDQIKAIREGDGPEGVTDPAHVFDVARDSRALTAGVTLATTFVAFATIEAGKQSGAARKTWLVMSGNPRIEHAAMNGETVSIDDNFSNGAKWPGDPVLGADGVAGCSCEVEVVF